MSSSLGSSAGLPSDRDLGRFSIEAPRYTSYPSAAEFSTDVGPAAFADALAEAADDAGGTPLSLYVHLPFCRSMCHFCGCHAITAGSPERIDRYLGALAMEAITVGRALACARPISEVHFGGGSPSLLEADQLERVVTSLRAALRFAEPVSLSLEADPRTVSLEKLRRYRALGVGRVSFGFQDLDDGVQRAIGRNQSAAVSKQAFADARAVGFDNINVDLCYGLPEQSESTFARTIAEVISLAPERIAIFGYAHVPWVKPMQRRIRADELPRADLRLRLISGARAALLSAGYRAIGLDHFARPTDALAAAAAAGTLHRNFQGYTATTTGGVIGLGLSAISDLPRGYYQNHRALAAYQRAVTAGVPPTERGVVRSPDDVVRGWMIQELMCRFRVSITAVEHRYAVRFDEAFAREMVELAELAALGVVRLTPTAIELTALGTVFVRNVARVFDVYSRRNCAVRFSRTI
jgi:oxygen-independent coproporphyrinogen-3 oxidase